MRIVPIDELHLNADYQLVNGGAQEPENATVNGAFRNAHFLRYLRVSWGGLGFGKPFIRLVQSAPYRVALLRQPSPFFAVNFAGNAVVNREKP